MLNCLSYLGREPTAIFTQIVLLAITSSLPWKIQQNKPQITELHLNDGYTDTLKKEIFCKYLAQWYRLDSNVGSPILKLDVLSSDTNVWKLSRNIYHLLCHFSKELLDDRLKVYWIQKLWLQYFLYTILFESKNENCSVDQRGRGHYKIKMRTFFFLLTYFRNSLS